MTHLCTSLAFIFLAACGTALAQDKTLPLALKGNDPVSYFSGKGPLKGALSNSYDFDDTRYLFSSPRNRELFASNPDRYAPQFTGLCTTGLAYGMKVEANPDIYLVRDGKLYVFSSTESRDMAMKDPSLLEKAREAWKAK